MKITGEGELIQLSFLPRMFPVNCYLVEERDGLTLIDAGLPYSDRAIRQAAAAIGKPIVRIVLTHGHEDHVGALDKLKAALPDVPVLISARDSRLLAGDCSLDASEEGMPVRGSVPKKLKTRADTLLSDGDRIGSLIAIATPGHTPGSMSFFDTRSRAVIAGDAMHTRGGIAVSGQMKLLFPFPALATWSKQAAIDSVRRLRELKPSLLAVGHGRMLREPDAAMAAALDAATNEGRTRHGKKRA